MRQRRVARQTSRKLRRLYLCATCSLLLSCQPQGPDAPFENYLSSLGAALSVDTPKLQHTAALPPLAATGLQLDIPATGAENLDFLTLSGCAVQVTIGKLDSNIGRFPKPSQRLLLTLEYLRLAPVCITQLRYRGKDALADVLQSSWHQQQLQLPILIFNATLGSDEYRALWRAAPAPGAYPRINHGTTVTALVAINSQVHRWLRGNYRARDRNFELLLGEVAGGDAGALLQSLSRQHDWLTNADLMLKQGFAAGAVCSANRMSTTSLHSIIRRHFNEHMQQDSGLMSQHLQELLLAVAGLEMQLSSILPTNYRHWIKDRNSRARGAKNSLGRHIERVALLQQRCEVG